jgi:hypothetical protein
MIILYIYSEACTRHSTYIIIKRQIKGYLNLALQEVLVKYKSQIINKYTNLNIKCIHQEKCPLDKIFRKGLLKKVTFKLEFEG